ncbi:hypothetical protein Emed_001409 [Eimeria media]
MGPGEVDVAVVISDSDQDALSDKQLLREQQQTPRKAASHQLQQQDEASLRRTRRSVNLDDSDDSQEGPTGPPSPGLSLAAACAAGPRRSARLAAARCSFPPAVSTPQSTRKCRTPVRNTTPPGGGPSSVKASSPQASSPISICTPSFPRRFSGRLRRPENSLSRGSSASPQIRAEEDASRPRRRRRSRLLVIAEEDSSEEHSQPSHDHVAGNSNNSSSSSSSSSNSNSGLAEGQQDGPGASGLEASTSPRKEGESVEASLQRDSDGSNSSSSDNASSRMLKRRRRGNVAASRSSRTSQNSKDTASHSSSSNQLEPRSGRLRRGAFESAEEQQQQQQESQAECESSGKDACKENVTERARPSPKEVQQRLRELAKSVKQKQMRSRGLHASDKSQEAGGSSVDVDDSSSDSSSSTEGSSSSTDGSSSSSNERPRARVRAPASARKASKFFSFSRDLQEAVSDSGSSGSSFIVDSPTAEEEASRASEEALSSDSSDSSEDEALSALRFHNRMKEQQETSQAVEQTMRLDECFDKYLFSLALSLFSPELSLKKLQEKRLPIPPSSSSPVAKALGALDKVEVRLLVGAAGRIERLTLAKRNSVSQGICVNFICRRPPEALLFCNFSNHLLSLSARAAVFFQMETHAFPPECKEHLKRYPECRLSEGPELQDAKIRRRLIQQGGPLEGGPPSKGPLFGAANDEMRRVSPSFQSSSLSRPHGRHLRLRSKEEEVPAAAAAAADVACVDADALWEGDVSSWLASKGLDWIASRTTAGGGEGPPLPSRKTPAGLVECYEARTGEELPVGAKCGKQAALWHAVHHYKARLLMSIHSILRLRHPDELRDPCAAAERLRELHGSGFFADWEEEVMSLPIPRQSGVTRRDYSAV